MPSVSSQARQSRPLVTTEQRAFSIPQFCQAFGVGRSICYEMIAAGKLKTYTVGRRRFISVAAAEAWQATLEAEANPPSYQCFVVGA